MEKKTTFVLLLAVFAVVGAALAISGSGTSTKDSCGGKYGQTFNVTIRNGEVSNDRIAGKLCDRMHLTNEDAITREIAFGVHDSHVPYDGVGEKFLNKGQSFTITFDTAGSFHWHDHEHDEVEGFFDVTK